jgi:DNA polymerase
MDIITLDVESEFDRDYTLSKLSTEAYVRDPRFAALGAGVRWPDGQAEWFDPSRLPELRARLAALLPHSALLCHHCQFDGLILSHHFGLRPKYWLDTLSMARQVIGNHLPKGLDSLAAHFGLPAKNVPYGLFKGKHWDEIPPADQALVADGCLHDVELTWTIFQRLAREFPTSEYALVDLTVRMFTEPVLEGDIDLFGRLWLAERDRKRGLLARAGVTAGDLQSSTRFAELLRQAGCEPERKAGKAGPLALYAFARTDRFMRDLQDGPDEYLADLVRARLGIRSTIVQTRVERLGDAAVRGALPVYLQYCGAHTTRWSGGDSTNFQNFTRGHPIRDALRVPDGFVGAVVDASQIECRILNCYAGQADIVAAFREGRDLYAELAAKLYRRPITRADARERQVGKILELASGYGGGAITLQRVLANGSPAIQMAPGEAEEAVRLYRTTHLQVTSLWASLGLLLPILADRDHPPVHVGRDVWVARGRLWGPTGTWIDYSTLEPDPGKPGWRFRKRDGWTRIWGGFLTENLVQFLARIHLGEVMKSLIREGIPRIVLCTHDDIFALVRDDQDAEKWLARMIAVMSTPPAWMPEMPLAAEGHLGHTYGEAK